MSKTGKQIVAGLVIEKVFEETITFLKNSPLGISEKSLDKITIEELYNDVNITILKGFKQAIEARLGVFENG